MGRPHLFASGHSGTTTTNPSVEYANWCRMKRACNNIKEPRYRKIGALGIKYQEDWEIFVNFLQDMGTCPEGCSLKRKDTTKDFTKENCHWGLKYN